MYIDAIKNADQTHQILVGGLVLLILIMLYRVLVKKGEQERYGAPGSQNLVSTMSKEEYEKKLNDPQCKVAYTDFCNFYCNEGTNEDLTNQAEKVMDVCGEQFPVLRTCPMECTLPQYLTIRGGSMENNNMVDKIYNSYINPFDSKSVFPGVTSKDTAPSSQFGLR